MRSKYVLEITLQTEAESPDEAAKAALAALVEIVSHPLVLIGVKACEPETAEPSMPMSNGTTDGPSEASNVFERIMAAPDV